MAANDEEFVRSLGADETLFHRGGFRLLMDGRTVAYGAETAKGVRLRVLTDTLPQQLTGGLKVEPIRSGKQLSVHVPKDKAAKVRPILENVARKQKAAKR